MKSDTFALPQAGNIVLIVLLVVLLAASCLPFFVLAQTMTDATLIGQATTTASTTASIDLESASSTQATSTAATSTPVVPPTNDGIEAKVRAYFASLPIMTEIARCESKFRQYNKLGDALDGGAGGMIGIFQIHAKVHADFAKSMGMDIYTVDGNMAYAKYLNGKEGTNPWLSSIGCWNAADSGASLGSGLTLALSMGMQNGEVLLLQKTLNKADFTVATAGPGSPGQETTKFGALTRAAVRKFQCAKGIACSGDEYSTGYGKVGKLTRAALLAVSKPVPGLVEGASTSTVSAGVSGNSAEVARLQALVASLLAQLAALQGTSVALQHAI